MIKIQKKTLLSVIFFLVITLFIFSSLMVNAASILGDVNGDGTINSTDESLIQRHMLGISNVNDEKTADLNGDQKINSTDTSLIQRYILGIITSFNSSSPTITTTQTTTMTKTPTQTPTQTPTTTKPKQTVKVMPLGDSITDGVNMAGGYRIKLWNSIITSGLTVDFVGSMSNGPSSLGDKNHEGHSGYRIDQIDSNINSWMDKYQPQIVLLHIGTNDITQNYNLNNAPDRIISLIDKICAKLPSGGKLYVAKIIPLFTTDYNNKISTINQKVASSIQSKASQGKPVYSVDMNSALTGSDLADGVHPNQNGYNKMADVWFKAIKNDLN